MITYVHTKSLYPTVYSDFILIAPGWKQLKFPYVREQKKCTFIQMEYYAVLRGMNK